MFDQCRRERRPLPPKFANAPELWWGLELFYAAFMDLMTDRPITAGGEGPIPWSAVGRWCDEHRISGDQRADVRYHVASLDACYLEYQAKRNKSNAKDGIKAGSERPTRIRKASKGSR